MPNTCRPAPATDRLDDEVAGRACDEDGDCEGGRCATMRGGFMGQGGSELPGGYCSGACLEDSHCGSGGRCVPSPLPGAAGSCYSVCDEDADCERDGYRCRTLAQGLTGCDAAADPLPDGVAGMACASDAECGGGAGSCADTLPAGGGFGQGLPAPGGYCSADCSEPSDCGQGGVCVQTFFSGRCYRPCEGATDCRDGYACQMRGGAGSASLVCVPAPPPEPTDAGAPATDSGTPAGDAGVSPMDSGPQPQDGGPPAEDSGVDESDAGA